MPDYPFLPGSVEFSIVHFQLEFLEPYSLSLESLLRLRRDLHGAGRQVLGERFAPLFDPALPPDPVALKRYQRPGAPFALSFSAKQAGYYDSGDRLQMSVCFWGSGIQRVVDFATVLQRLGSIGLHRGEGFFELAAIEAEDAAGSRHVLWTGGQLHELAPPVNDLRWWLEVSTPVDSLVLEFETPARLLSRGKPLFRIDFRQLFPYILRRVTSVLYAHCGCEVQADVASLLAEAASVDVNENRLCWKDWRVLEGSEQSQELGGVSGSILLSGGALQPLLWILRTGSLLNLGKGASYGAGIFRLHSRG